MNRLSLQLCGVALAISSVGLAAVQDQAPNPQGRGRLLGRPSPPQPQQKQGLDYFAGKWRFAWSGRESDITSGPRTGTAVFALRDNAAAGTLAIDGTSDARGPYKEAGTLRWDEAKKTLTIDETLASGARVTGVGDWSSPIGIAFESAPLSFAGKTLRVRRHYAILGPGSFSISEEISVDGGPYQRLGRGDFQKMP
jgi:hypothetical protein